MTLFIAAAIGVALLILLPRKYSSEAKFLVKIGRESVGLDPTATTSQTLLLQKTQEEEINSALEVMYSRTVKEAVVNELGVDTILSGFLPSDPTGAAPRVNWLRTKFDGVLSGLGGVLLDIGVRDPVDDFERAILKLEDDTYVYATKKTQVVSASAEAKSPKLAQEIVNVMVESYLGEHRKISQTSGSYDLFKNESEQSKIALDNAKNKMAKFMSENQIISVESNQGLLRDTWNGILSNVLDLESQENSLSSSYSKNHPLRIAAMERLASARQALFALKNKNGDDKIPGAIKNILSGVDDKSVLNSAGDIEVDPKALTMIGRVDELMLANGKLEIMQEKVEALETQLLDHRKKFEEARMIRLQQESSISNIAVFQPATFNQKPIAPNKILVLVATMFMCFSAAGLLCLWREADRKRSTLRHEEDVERMLSCPVLGTIPVDRAVAGVKKDPTNLTQVGEKCHRAIHTMIQNRSQDNRDSGALVVGVLSVEKGSGGSTLASALAVCFAKEFELKTLLVDTDLKARSISHQFSLNGAPGLAELVEGADRNKCLQQAEELSILASTNKRIFESKIRKMGASEVLKQLKQFRDEFEVIVVDLPPASEGSSGVFLATQLENVLLVAEVDKTTPQLARQVLQKFESSDAIVNGIFLNKYRREFPWESSN